MDVALSTVYRVKQRFAEEGLEKVLQDRPQANRPRKLDDRGEAHLIAPRSWPGAGFGLQPAAGRVTATGPCGWPGKWWSWGWRPPCPMRESESVSKKHSQAVAEEGVCIPKVSAEFVANMEDVLDLYAEPHDPQRPVVCFDETSTQLLAEIPPRPGRPLRQDYEYRKGTRNLFLACEPLAGWRHVAVTERRTMHFARRMRWLVDEAYPEAEVVRVVLDNRTPIAGHTRLSRLRNLPGGWSSTTPPSTGVELNPRIKYGAGYGRSSSAYCPAPA